MRFQQSPKTPQIVPSVEWLSLQDAARSALYPFVEQFREDVDDRRPGGQAQFSTPARRPDVDLAKIHETVFIGTPENPGLMRTGVLFSGGDVSAQPARPNINVPGIPSGGRQFGEEREGRGPVLGPRLEEVQYAIRAVEIADSLLPQIYQQTFSEVPLGYTDADVNVVRTERWVELTDQINDLAQQTIDLETERQRTTDPNRANALDNQIANLNARQQRLETERVSEESQTGYAIAPGRAYLDRWDVARQEFAQQVRENRRLYTPEMVRSAETALNYAESLEKQSMPASMRRYGEFGDELLVPSDVSMVLRQMTPAQRRSLKEDLIFVGPLNDNDINSMTAIDPATEQALGEIIYEAQRNGQQWDVYLQELVNSEFVRERADSRGGGGGRGFTIQLPAKEDVKQLVQAVAGQQLGMNIDDAAAEAISQQYLQYFQTTFQSQMGASVVNEPMSAETFVTQQVQREFETDYDVYQMGEKLNVFRRMLGGQ